MSKADNKELEEAINKLKETQDSYLKDELDLAIEAVLKELKRLQEDCISKDKIREKIEELEKEYKEALEENSTKAFILKCQIEILKELIAK